MPSNPSSIWKSRHRFETCASSTKEDRLRAKRLRLQLATPSTCVDPRALARLAERLSCDRTPKSLASSRSFRRLRRSVIGHLLEALRRYRDEDLRTFTILNTGWRFTVDELQVINPRTIKSELEDHLRKAGIRVSDGPLIAFLDGEFEPTSGVFVLHFHGVTTENTAKLLRTLSRRWGYEKTASGASAVRIARVRDRERQFGYLLKSFWPERTIRMVDGIPKRDRKRHRIHEPYHSAQLCWMDRQRLLDLTVTIGTWSRRSGGPDDMRALQLIIERW